MFYAPKVVHRQEQNQNGVCAPQASPLASPGRGEMAAAPTGLTTRWRGQRRGAEDSCRQHLAAQPQQWTPVTDKALEGRCSELGHIAAPLGSAPLRCLRRHFDCSTALWGEKNHKLLRKNSILPRL